MSGGFGRAPGKSSSLQEQASKVIAPAAPGKRTLTDQLRAVQGSASSPVQSLSDGPDGRAPVQRQAVDAGYNDIVAAARAPSDGASFQRTGAQGASGPGGPPSHRQQIQCLFGRQDISGMEAHVDGGAPAASRAIGAETCATGHHTALAATARESAESDQQLPATEPIFPSATPAQRKTTTSAATDAGGPPPPGGAGTPLPPDVRTRMETALGASFAAVRVHEDAYAQRIGAQAFTRGVDLFFAPGRFDPRSPQGLELIGHELTHVKQQAEGRVPVTARIDGAPANDDPGLEREADELGAKAARAMAARGATAPHAGAGSQIANAPTAPASHVPVQAKADGAAIDAPPGSEPRVEDLDEVDAADASNASAASMAPIQKAPTGQPGKARRPRRTISRSRSPWQSR